MNASIDVTDYRCSCCNLLTECDFFKEIARRVTACGLEFSYQDFRTTYQQGNEFKQKLLYGSLRSNCLETIRDHLRKFWPGCMRFIRERDLYNQTFIRAISEFSEKKFFLDASKGPARIPFLTRLHDGPMHVLHITRDVRAFSNSFKKNSGEDVATSAKSWVRSHRNILRICKKENVSYGRFRYEDVCGDTEKTIRKIYAHCKLDPDVDVLFEPRNLHLIGNRMRLRSDMTIHLDESWKVELTQEEQDIAWNIGKDLMQSFDYSR